MLYGAAGKPAVTSPASFTDVSPSDYYYTAVSWAQANGLATGVGDGTLAPASDVTREQAFTILNQALPLLGITCQPGALTVLDQFGDRASLSDWAAQHAATLVAYQIVGGDTDGNLNPQAFLTRAEMAALLYKLSIWTPATWSSRRRTLSRAAPPPPARQRARAKLLIRTSRRTRDRPASRRSPLSPWRASPWTPAN